MNSYIRGTSWRAFAFAVTVGCSAASYAGMETPLADVHSLTTEASHSVETLRLYAQAFHLSESAVVPYLSTLSISKLPADGTYTVLEEGSTPTKALSAFHAGDPVFVDVTGQPVIRASDGAPIIAPDTAPTANSGASGASGSLGGASVGFQQTTQQDSGSAPQSFGSGSGLLAGLEGLALLGSGIGGSGGHDLGPGGGGTHPAGAPEPASFLALGLGAGIMTAGRMRKKK